MRITDYVVLTSPAPTDVVPVVDIDDPTMSAFGTTKQISVAALLSPPATVVSLSGSSGSFSVPAQVTLTSVVFTAAGRLRLYPSSATQSADSARPLGTPPDPASGILYEYDADTANSDLETAVLYVSTGTIFWGIDSGSPTVTLTWVQT